MGSRVTINERGVIAIPAALRRAFGLSAGDELIVEKTPEGILLRPSINVPIEMYIDERIAEFATEEELAKRFPPPPGE